MGGKMMDGMMMVSRRIRDGDGRVMTTRTGNIVIRPTAVSPDVKEQTLAFTAGSNAREMAMICVG